jgi:hypothetical protein
MFLIERLVGEFGNTLRTKGDELRSRSFFCSMKERVIKKSRMLYLVFDVCISD